MSDLSELAKYIIRARELQGWSRAELARKADIPYTTLRNIERSKKNVRTSEDVLQAIADVLPDASFDELRVLAGYLLVKSTGDEVRDRRFLANLGAYPYLRKALEDLLENADSDEVDRAFTALEVHRRLERDARRVKRQ